MSDLEKGEGRVKQPKKNDRPKKPLNDEAWICGGLAVFFAIVAPAYHFIAGEVIGTIALLLALVLFLMIFTYLMVIGRRELRTPRPSDSPRAEIVEGVGDQGFYPPQSIWPLWCALSITVIFLGIVFGWWISLLGFALGIWATSGMVFEYYRGDYAH